MIKDQHGQSYPLALSRCLSKLSCADPRCATLNARPKSCSAASAL